MIRLTELMTKIITYSPQTSTLPARVQALFGSRCPGGHSLVLWNSLLCDFETSWKLDRHVSHQYLVELVAIMSGTPSISDLVTGTPWDQHLDSGTLEMPAMSECGSDCTSLILRVDLLLADMADVRSRRLCNVIEGMQSFASEYLSTSDALMKVVGRQCSTFVHG